MPKLESEGGMNRLRMLKKFEQLAHRESLGSDEVRVYLLLLANCRAQTRGELDYATVRNTVGKEFSLAKFKRAYRVLSMHGVIEVLPSPIHSVHVKYIGIAYRILL